MDAVSAAGQAVWLYLPCYMANMAPVGAARLFPRWSRPIDGGRTASDGRPVLGPNKTWRGLAAGTLAGGATALLLAFIAAGRWADLDFGRSQGAPWAGIAAFGLALGAAALAGDAAKSYAKRRLGRPSGSPWVPFDQLDIVPAGVAAAFMASPLIGPTWVLRHHLALPVVLAFLVLTPLLHYASSVLAYISGLKQRPW